MNDQPTNQPTPSDATGEALPKVEEFIHWVVSTRSRSLDGSSRVAFDAQVRILHRLKEYLSGNHDADPYVDLAVKTKPLYEDLEAEVTRLRERMASMETRYKGLVDFYDQHNGTPCEQVRHRQEVEALQAERDKHKGLAEVYWKEARSWQNQIIGLTRERDTLQATLTRVEDRRRGREEDLIDEINRLRSRLGWGRYREDEILKETL